MCHAPLRALLLAGLALLAHGETLTVVLDFDGPRSDRSVDVMKREVEDLMKPRGLTIDWKSRDLAARESYGNLVVVRFKGKCILEPVGYLYDERGPLAFTWSTEGLVQPFSEVACDHLTGVVRSAMFGGDFARADLLFGRALGRVVAHELVHILSRSAVHTATGITRPALSGSQLISSDRPDSHQSTR